MIDGGVNSQEPGATPRVHVLSGQIQSGKTTRLAQWAAELNAGGREIVDGILAPVISGNRHLKRLSTGELRNLQDVPPGAAATAVGRFTFNADVFAWARAGLVDAARGLQASAQGWLVVDEIGPLELSGRGLQPAVTTVCEIQRASCFNLVLVIREFLVDRVLQDLGIPGGAVAGFLTA